MRISFVPILLFAGSGSAFASEVEEPGTTTLWEVLLSGGPVMYPLAGLSVAAVMLAVVYFFSLRRSSVASGRYMQTADALIRKRDWLGLLAVSNRHDDAVAGVVERSLSFLTENPNAGIAQVREIAEAEGMRLAGLWNQRISYLMDIGSIAPMLGLFGTVLGMIKSFSVVASDIAASRPMMLAEGVAEALITTAAGLLVGIPAIAAHAFFRGRVQSMVSDLESASTVLVAKIDAALAGGNDKA